jgi:hypothetical protein
MVLRRALCMQDKYEVEGISGLAIVVDEDKHEKEKTLNVVYRQYLYWSNKDDTIKHC